MPWKRMFASVVVLGMVGVAAALEAQVTASQGAPPAAGTQVTDVWAQVRQNLHAYNFDSIPGLTVAQGEEILKKLEQWKSSVSRGEVSIGIDNVVLGEVLTGATLLSALTLEQRAIVLDRRERKKCKSGNLPDSLINELQRKIDAEACAAFPQIKKDIEAKLRRKSTP